MASNNMATCAGCGKHHDGSFMQRFCSASCEWVYHWRRRMGFTNPD